MFRRFPFLLIDEFADVTVMTVGLSFSLTLSIIAASTIAGAQYTLVKDYSGPSFFDDWNFYGFRELLNIHSMVVKS